VVALVVVLPTLVGEVGHLREVDGHLPGRVGRVLEVDDITVLDHAAVVSGNAFGLEQFEVERAHRTETRALPGNLVGHLPQSNTE